LVSDYGAVITGDFHGATLAAVQHRTLLMGASLRFRQNRNFGWRDG